jgi:hypothetical protein
MRCHHRQLAAATGLVLSLAGCGAAHQTAPPLGRPLDSPTPTVPAPTASPRSPAPAGDPPHERGGRIPTAAAIAQNKPTAAGLAPSPTAALARYALVYTNWRAAQLPARERELAALAVGPARLDAEQTAAAQSGATALAAHNVANTGQIVAIAPGEGPYTGQWVVVTEEQTTGSGPYAGLPAGPHVTLARLAHLPGGWAVSAWNPIS